MTPKIFNESKNLFLIFPPGCGGNHLANLLCTHPSFAPRYSHTDYVNDLQLKYKHFFGSKVSKGEFGCTAHFSDLENLQREHLNKFQDKIINQSKPYIFCSHAAEYLIGNQEGILNSYDKKIFCLFSNPSGSNKLVNHRMRTGAWFLGEPDDIIFRGTLVKDLYVKETFSKKGNIDPDKIFTLDTDLYYDLNGYTYIFNIIKDNLGIELPDFCETMHRQYIEYSSIIFGEG